MKPSFYNFYQHSEKNTLIFNTISGKCVVIPKESTDSCNQKKLNEMGFYVCDDTNELEELVSSGKFRLTHANYNKYRVLTTTACNARCHYCYEAGVQAVSMDKATAGKVADFILSQNKHQHLIGIEWFGGEPLLNTSAITHITDKIMKSKPKEVNFEAYMVTNGSLLNNEIISRMEGHWNIKRVQITLDGVGNDYEKVKKLPSGSFEKIIDNLRLLCRKQIKVNIRLNFNQHNLNEMKTVIEYLSKLDFKNRLYVYPAPIFEAIPKPQTKIESAEIKNAELKMYDLLYRNGLMTSLSLLPHIMSSPCAASKPGYFTINANGDIYKCDRKFLPSNRVGSVFNQPFINSDVSKWSDITVRPRCKNCRMFPLCWGGCIYEVMAGVERCHFSEDVIQHNLSLLLNEYESIANVSNKN